MLNESSTSRVATHTTMGKSLAFFIGSTSVGVAYSPQVFDTLAFEFNLHADKFDVSAEV